MSFTDAEYPARRYTLNKTTLGKIPERVRSRACDLLPVPSVRAGPVSWDTFAKACRDGTFGGVDIGVEDESLMYCFVVLVTKEIRVLFVHCHPCTPTMEPEVVKDKVKQLLDEGKTGAILMQYSHLVGNNRMLQSPEEMFLNPHAVDENFLSSEGAIEDLSFRRLIATKEGEVIRPVESLYDGNYIIVDALPRVTLKDNLYTALDPELMKFPRSKEKWPVRPIGEADSKATDAREDEKNKDDEGEGDGDGEDEGSDDGGDSGDENGDNGGALGDETNKDFLAEPNPGDLDEHTQDGRGEDMDTEMTGDNAKGKPSIFSRLGPKREHPAKESTPDIATPSTSHSGKGASKPRVSSRGLPQAGSRGPGLFPGGDVPMGDIVQWYSRGVDDACPSKDEAIRSLYKAEKIKRKFLRTCSKRLSRAQSQEYESATQLQVQLAELMSNQAEEQAKSEAEANMYRHIARSLKVEEMADARMDYDVAVSDIEQRCESYVATATTHFGRKRLKVAADTKVALKEMLNDKMTSMMQDRSALVDRLREEESAIDEHIRDLREDAMTNKCETASAITETFDATEALSSLCLPALPWQMLEALLASKPSLSDSLYSALGSEYRLNRPSPSLDISIEDDDSVTARKLQSLMTVIHSRECSETVISPTKKKQTAPPKVLAGKAKPKPKAQLDKTAENAKKVLEMTTESKRAALDNDEQVLMFVRNKAYSNYSFVDITRYYSDETKLIEEIYKGRERNVLLTREELQERSGLSSEKLKDLVMVCVRRDHQATGKTRHKMAKMSASALGGDDDSQPEGVVDHKSIEDKEAMVQYFFIIEPHKAHSETDGLLDHHSKGALGRNYPVAPGDSLKVAVCSWCGYATQNAASTCAHICKNHEGILLVCGCFTYASFRADSVATHWPNCPAG